MTWRQHPDITHGKYTYWARELTDDQLVGLLWCVGEFGIRAWPEDHDVGNADTPAEARKIGALDMLVGFARRKPKTIDEVRWKIQDLVHNDPRFAEKYPVELIPCITFTCTNEARYYLDGDYAPTRCGVCDIIDNGGRGKLRHER